MLEELRDSGIFSLEEVEYAILETSGKISVIKKPEKTPATKEDLKVATTYVGYPRPLIIDGSYITKNLEIMGVSQKEVNQYLKKENTTLEDVFLLMYDENQQYFLQKREETQKK